jgi:hypothetical protein
VGSLASAFSNVVVDLIRIEEEYGLPGGMVLQAMTNKISTTHLYGSKEIYAWIKKHNYNAMAKISNKLKPKFTHNNIPTGERMPANNLSIKVF